MNPPIYKLAKLSPAQIESYRNWFTARDYFCGKNGKARDFSQSYYLAKVSQHPDACYFCTLFPDSIPNPHSMLKILEILRLHLHDRRALCLYGHACGDETKVKESAQLNYLYAQMQLKEYETTNFAYVTEDYEPEMIYQTAQYHNSMIDYNKDPSRKIFMLDCYKLASELGHAKAMKGYSCVLDRDDPQKYYWMGRALEHIRNKDSVNIFCQNIHDHIDTFHKVIILPILNKILFQLGRALKRFHLAGKFSFTGLDSNGACQTQLFGHFLHDRVKDYTLLLVIYDKWYQAARDATLCWMLISKRLPIHKDLRKVIANMVWARRVDADYLILSNLQK